MGNEEFDSTVLNNPLPDNPGDAENEILRLTAKGSPYWSERNPFHNKVCDRVEQLYEIKNRRMEEKLKDTLPEHRDLAQRIFKEVGSTSEVQAEGAEARQEWQDEILEGMVKVAEGQLKSEWGRDFDTKFGHAKFIVDTYLIGESVPEKEREANRLWLETSVAPGEPPPGSDPYLIRKLSELGEYLERKYYSRQRTKKGEK